MDAASNVILQLESGGAAQAAGLQENDVITGSFRAQSMFNSVLMVWVAHLAVYAVHSYRYDRRYGHQGRLHSPSMDCQQGHRSDADCAPCHSFSEIPEAREICAAAITY